MNPRSPRSLADYIRAARRRKFVVVIPGVIMALATAAAVGKLPNQYESSARLVISVNSNVPVDLPGHLKEFRRHIINNEIIAGIMSRYEPGVAATESGAAEVRRRIGIDPDRRDAQPGAFAISYRSTDPETARSVTAELVDRLMARTIEHGSPSSEIQNLRKRASDISKQLRELEEREPGLLGRSTFGAVAPQPAHNAPFSAEAQRAQQMTIESLKDQQYKIQQQLADVERRITSQRQVVDQQKRGASLRDNPTFAALITRRTELQGQRDTLINRQQLTDKHPRVAAIDDQIAAINRQIEELRHQDASVASQSPEARELAALESERNRLRIDLEVATRELARRSANAPAQHPNTNSMEPRRGAVPSRLAQQYFSLKRSYDDVTGGLQAEEGRHKSSNASAEVQLRMLEPATLPEDPISPNRPMFVATAAVLGLALGVLFALLYEARRFKSLRDERDVEYYARLPLLGAIPKTSTAVEHRRALWRARARLAFATAISLVATFALTKILIVTDIFTLITEK